MKIDKITYLIEDYNGFPSINIYRFSKGKYLIGCEFPEEGNLRFLVEGTNLIAGGWAFLNQKEKISEKMGYFTSLKQCKEHIFHMTPENLAKVFSEHEVNGRNYLLADKTQK